MQSLGGDHDPHRLDLDMLKMFHQHESAGSTAAYWESMWGVIDPASYAIQARRHCEASPVWKIITSKLDPQRLFIDGGCGHGYWVKYLHDRGQRAAGVDFADSTLGQLRRIDPGLDVRFADVRDMPFQQGEVHVYFSHGVVEHFEDGPTAALREARRVVADDGWFLCTVPDASPLRERILYRAATETRSVRNGPLLVRRASHTTTESPDAVSGEVVRFFQYVFEENEFRRHLGEAGFEVIETFGESFVWGLLEVDAIRRLHDRARHAWRALRHRDNGVPGPGNGAVMRNVGAAHARGRPDTSLRALPRRILFNEDRSIPVLGGAVGLFAELAANQRMYVARPARAFS